MAALVTVIAGRYSSTFTLPAGSPLDLGVTNDPGYTLSWTYEMDNVKDTDAYGAQVIEQCYLGPSDVSLDFVSKEYKQGPVNAIANFTVTGATSFKAGLVGLRATDIAGSCIMTTTALTPAALTPINMTFTYAIVHEGVNTAIIFGPRHRTVPIRFRILPTSSTGAQYWSATIWLILAGLTLWASLLSSLGLGS